jgi:hypothetical protein
LVEAGHTRKRRFAFAVPKYRLRPAVSERGHEPSISEIQPYGPRPCVVILRCRGEEIQFRQGVEVTVPDGSPIDVEEVHQPPVSNRIGTAISCRQRTQPLQVRDGLHRLEGWHLAVQRVADVLQQPVVSRRIEAAGVFDGAVLGVTDDAAHRQVVTG